MLFRELHGRTFPCGSDVWEFRGCGRDHGIEKGIVMAGIVVEKQQALRPGFTGDPPALSPRTMSPATVGFVFLGRVLSVEDQQVRALAILQQHLIELVMSVLQVGPLR